MRLSLLSSLLFLAACSKTAGPGKLADFIGAPGKLEAACVEANDGKRFIVDGHVVPSDDVSVTDGRVSLRLSEDSEGQGLSAVLQFKEGTHVDFAVVDVKSTFTGGMAGTKGTLTGVTLHTDKGDATPADRLGVVFDVEVLHQFQTNAITACIYKVVDLRKP